MLLPARAAAGTAAAWENAIGRAVKDTVREGSRSLLRVVELLSGASRQPAREAGEALEVIATSAWRAWGSVTGRDTLREATRSVTTIRMPGLSLPDPAASRDTYTRSERVSVATLGLVAAYALRLISHDRSRHKVVLLDEIWFLLAHRRAARSSTGSCGWVARSTRPFCSARSASRTSGISRT